MYTNTNIKKIKEYEPYIKTKDRTIVPPVIPFKDKKKYNRKIKHKISIGLIRGI